MDQRYLFTVKSSDNEFISKVKTEGNILLTSAFNQYGIGSELRDVERRVDRIISVLQTVDNFGVKPKDSIIEFIKELTSFVKTGLLSPLTLKDDEFKLLETDEISEWYENTRYPYIERKDTSGLGITNKVYYNNKAFNCIIKTAYDNKTNKQTKQIGKHTNITSPRVYITRGGVITEDYINECIIPKTGDYKHLTIPVDLPVSLIYTNDGDVLYTVEHREPKYKELCELYNVELGIDNDIKGKYDIRKYEKINK